VNKIDYMDQKVHQGGQLCLVFLMSSSLQRNVSFTRTNGIIESSSTPTRLKPVWGVTIPPMNTPESSVGSNGSDNNGHNNNISSSTDTTLLLNGKEGYNNNNNGKIVM